MNAWVRDYPDVDEKLHNTIINYCHVYCDYIYCDYSEYFPSIEDAETAATIHEEGNN